jgi:hypothetical protein
MGVTPAGILGFGPLRLVRVKSKKPPSIRQVPANVFVKGCSFHTLEYEKVPFERMVIVIAHVSVPCALFPSRCQAPGISFVNLASSFVNLASSFVKLTSSFVNLASRPQPASSKPNAKIANVYFIMEFNRRVPTKIQNQPRPAASRFQSEINLKS